MCCRVIGHEVRAALQLKSNTTTNILMHCFVIVVQVPVASIQAALADDDWRAAVGLVPCAKYDTALGVLGNVSALLPMLKAGQHSEIGRRALATVMAAVVEPAGAAGMVPNVRYEEALGINRKSVAAARERRAAALTATAEGKSPQEAVAAGDYLFQERNTRCDALSDVMIDVIDQFWHSDDITRTNGNTNDTKKRSKHRGAEEHPARVQMFTAAEAYEKFLQWGVYTAAKTAEGWGADKHVSFTVFQLHKCFCVGPVSNDKCSIVSSSGHSSSK